MSVNSIIFLSSLFGLEEQSFLTAQKILLINNTEERGEKPQKKESHPMASFAEAPAGDVAKGTRYIEFLLLIVLPSFAFLHVTRFTDVFSLFPLLSYS